MFIKKTLLAYFSEIFILGLILATSNTVMLHQPAVVIALSIFVCVSLGLYISLKKGWDLSISHVLLGATLILMLCLVHETPLATQGEANINATGFGMATSKSMPIHIQGHSYVITYKLCRFLDSNNYWFNVYQRSGWFYQRVTSKPYNVSVTTNVAIDSSPREVFKQYISQNSIIIHP